MIIRIIFCLLLVSSCNVIETLIDGETKLDEEFFEREGNSQNSSLTLFDGLVSFYRFDEVGGAGNFNDELGNNNLVVENATAISDAAIKSTGRFGGAVNCQGTDGVAALVKLSPQGLSFGNNTDFTIAFWIRRLGGDPTSGLGMILFNDFSNFYVQDNMGNASIGGALPGTSDFSISTALGSGDFEHVALRVQRNLGYSICINSSCSGYTSGITNSNSIDATSFRICSNSANNSVFQGDLDSLGIWNRLLSNDEVVELENGVDGLDF